MRNHERMTKRGGGKSKCMFEMQKESQWDRALHTLRKKDTVITGADIHTQRDGNYFKGGSRWTKGKKTPCSIAIEEGVGKRLGGKKRGP